MPKDPVAPDVLLKNTRGQKMNPYNLHHPRHARYRAVKKKKMTWENAVINHYAIRSRDLFLMKNLRGDGMGLKTNKYFLNSLFFRRYNRNVVSVPETAQHLIATRRVMAELREVGDVAEIEATAHARFAEMREKLLTEEQIASWTHIRRKDRIAAE